MPLLVYFLLLLLYLVSGLGILELFKLRLKPAYTISLSLLLGVALASFLPFLLQLFYIPLTGATVFGSLALAAVLLAVPLALRIRKEGFAAFRQAVFPSRFKVYSYEIPFWMVIGFLMFVSIWRCYYLPPTSRDVLSGPEAIAQFAVSEHTMVNSFFSIDLWSTNNQFKSPYLISLQLIYKLAGFPFGQIWLSIVFISFTVFLYHAVRETVHPLIAGLLLLIFFMTPELYAYTFMILYDYSNMVYMFLGLYFVFGYFKDQQAPRFYMAALLLGIATYIRSETLGLELLFLPAIFLSQRRAKLPLKRLVLGDIIFLAPSLVAYYLSGPLWIKHYLPVHYDVGSLVNDHLSDVSPLFQRYSDIVTRLFIGDFAIHLWGYFFFIAAILFVAELVFMRRFNKEARNWLYAVFVLYLGIGALGWALPLFNLNETTKRALFKLLPLIILYLANNGLLVRLSEAITRWENTPFLTRTAGASALSAPGRSVLTKSGKTVPATAGNQRKETQTAGAPGRRRKK
jgi:hypothetical protein